MKEKDKKTLNVRELVNKYQANCDRIGEIAETCEKEQRERTEAEDKEFAALTRENQLLQMKMQVATAEHLRENPNAATDAVKIIRENASRGQKSEIIFVRDLMMVSDVASGAIIPLNVQEIIKPLTEGFILDKVGLPMPTGLSGDFVWPMYEMVEAQIAGEGVALSDTKIPFSKMTAAPERVGIAIPVTNQSLNQSDGVLEMIIREIMPRSIRLLLNKILFSTSKVNGATNLVGPFVGKVATAVAISAVPKFSELNVNMKARLLETGIDGEHLCWIMTKSLAATLEGTPINEKGIFVPMLQNGMLCGLPVYTTNAIRNVEKTYKKWSGSAWADYTLAAGNTVKGQVSKTSELPTTGNTSGDIYAIADITEYVGLGDWRYQPMGLFGTIRFIVDPYSQARKDSVDFVLNTDYGTKTLRNEAFMLGKVATA
ncbi:MAG: phage major capsid protein [Duncaniella sp.]|uniref:phage major capsid protein n=1 Tax=Duncaniella sp. TaxID=2518496 RepID=UPI0023D5597D|nr:phage major capsid protein [Duncaniella sp.]MDE5989089.1 phage major capsid protein [Duncaniella sp.]